MRFEPNDTGFRLFGHLALHEDQQASLTQLCAVTGQSRRVVLAALKGLAEDDLVLAEPKPKGMGYGKLYQANRDHPIFDELRRIVIKMLGATNAVRDILLDNPAVEAAAIFGSVAAGADRRTGRLSDIDLLVVFADASTRDDRVALRSAVQSVSDELAREINVEGLTRTEWEEGKRTNRILKRIAAGSLLTLKGSLNA
jgi:predicted nucleotidyltransferase